MATKIFVAQTVPSNQTVVDDKLKPTAEMHILVGGPYTLNGENPDMGILRFASRQRQKTRSMTSAVMVERVGTSARRAKAFSGCGPISLHILLAKTP